MSILKRIFKLKDTVAVIAGILFVTKLLGFVKFRLIAGYFGASKELDIFWAAFLIPDTLFNILIAGSVNAAIIPVFSDVLYKDGEKRLVKLMSATIFAMSIIFVLLSVLIFIFARDVSGFLVDSGYIHSTLSLTSTLNSTDWNEGVPSMSSCISSRRLKLVTWISMLGRERNSKDSVIVIILAAVS